MGLSVLSYASSFKKPVMITFLGVKECIWLISMQLIFDMLRALKVPSQIMLSVCYSCQQKLENPTTVIAIFLHVLALNYAQVHFFCCQGDTIYACHQLLSC